MELNTTHYMDLNTNISFAGCGFIGIYHVGASVCLKKFAPHLLKNKIGGSSAGAMCAVALVCDLPLVEVTRNVAMLAFEVNDRMLGPFNPTFNLHRKLKTAFLDFFPEDVAEQSNGRLYLSLTKASNKSNMLISEFISKDDLVDAVCASSFVPVMSGLIPPKFRGEFAIDGGYSDNIPHLGGHTITVSPFAGDASICPSDESFASLILSIPHGSGGSVNLSSDNVRKLGDAIIPPNSKKMKEICSQGFDDAMKYLQICKMIRCQNCLDLPSDVFTDLSDSCDKCETLRKTANQEALPEEIEKVFDDIAEMEDKRKGLGSMILSMSSTVASNASKTISSTASLITSTVIGEGKRRFAMLQLFRLTLAPAKTLVMLQPSIKQCPFMDL